MSKTEMKIGQDLASSPLCVAEDDLRNKSEHWVQRLNRLDTITQELVNFTLRVLSFCLIDFGIKDNEII